MTAALPFAGAALLATFAVALARAMATKPDPTAPLVKNLNMLLLATMGWAALALNGAFAMFRFGLVLPAGAALLLVGAYKLALTLDLVPFYRFSIAFGVFAVIVTILVVSQNINLRSPS